MEAKEKMKRMSLSGEESNKEVEENMKTLSNRSLYKWEHKSQLLNPQQHLVRMNLLDLKTRDITKICALSWKLKQIKVSNRQIRKVKDYKNKFQKRNKDYKRLGVKSKSQPNKFSTLTSILMRQENNLQRSKKFVIFSKT